MSEPYVEPTPKQPYNGAGLTEYDCDPNTAGDVQELPLPEFEAGHRF